MKIRILAVGRGEKTFAPLEQEYQKRTRAFSLELLELKGFGEDAVARRREGEEILQRIPERYWVFALDERGEALASAPFAALLGEALRRAVPGVVFVIGGASGLDDAVRERADRILSLSALTLPHRLARLVIVEQLYRASTILRGEPYHK